VSHWQHHDLEIENSKNQSREYSVYIPAKWNVFSVICVDGSPTLDEG
jgi:hypothetical protein